MDDRSSLQLYFKEFIETGSPIRGIDRIKKTPDYVCDLFVYEPRNVEEAQLGTLFMLGKIDNIPKNKYKNFDFLLSLLISVIKREFYSDSKRPSLEALETGLSKANLYLADFTEKGNIEWIGNLNFVCGVFSEDTLHISQVGKPVIKLFRGTTVSHIENKFPTRKKAHPLKTFGNIASGTILSGDKIMLGTKDILNLVSLTSLKELSKGSCNQIIEGLKKLTEKKTKKTPIICLVLETKTEAPEEIAVCLPASPQDEPIREEIAPSRPSVRLAGIKSAALTSLLVFRKISIVIFLGIYKTVSFLIFVSKKAYKLLSPILAVGKWVFLKIKPRTLDKLKAQTQNLALNLIKRSKVKEKYYNLKTQIINFKNYKITALYQQNKLAFFAASLLVILILILPFAAAQKINHYVKTNNFNRLSAEIQEIQKKTDSALVYQDKEKAKGLLERNQVLVANLLTYSQKSPLRRSDQILSKITEIKEKHQEQQDSINNVIRIKELEEILDFSTSGFIVNPIGINKIKNYLYFYELDSGILYKFNLSPENENKDLILVFISAKDELRKMTSLENGRVVLLGQGGKVYLYNSNTNDHNAYLLEPPIPIENIKDVKNFLSNFYVLDTGQGNIIKYSSQPSGENIKGTNWLPEPAEELKQAQSMAIDGSVYILNSEGLIVKYYKGKKAEEINPQLEKPLGGDSKIFIRTDFKNFYIFDPKNKRLIVLNKQGEVINQYLNDELVNLQDFWVTKDEKEAYLLCGKKVFKLNL